MCSVPALVKAKGARGEIERFKASVCVLLTVDTATLITRVSVTDDSLLLWAFHLVLDKRGVAPALRWPPNLISPQNELVTFGLPPVSRTHRMT